MAQRAAQVLRGRRGIRRDARRLLRWRRYGAVAVAIVFAAFLTLAGLSRARKPETGISVAYDPTRAAWVVEKVAPISVAAEAGAKVGDELLLLDGIAPQVNIARDIADAGEVVLRRPTTGQEIALARYGRTAESPPLWAFAVIGSLFCAIGLSALAFGRGKATRALALLCCTGAFVIVNLPLGMRGFTWAIVINGLGVPLFIGSFAYLFLTFPVERSLPLFGRRFSVEWLLAPTLPITLSYYVAYLAPGEAAHRARLLLGIPYYLVCLAIGLAALGRSWWQAQGTRGERQLRLIALGTSLAVVPFFALTLIPTATGRRPLLAPEYSALPLCLIPLAFGYAILRYQVMDLHLYVRRGVIYSFFVASVAGVYGAALILVTLFANAWTQAGNVIAVGVLTIFIAIAGDRLRLRLTVFVDRLFDRRHYDYRQQLLDFSQQMSTIEDPDELAQVTIDHIAQTMGATRVRFYVHDAGREVYHLWVWAGPEPSEEDHLLGTRHPLVLDAQRAKRGFAQVLEAPLDTDALVLPLQHRGAPIALLTLGRKDSELPYSSEDLVLLRTVANQLAVATENSQLYGRMRDLYLSGVRTLAATVDAKDSYTHGHSERVAAYSRALAVALRLPQLEVETIELAGLLHDLGKIGVPDAVLQKPGRLDPDERALIERHADLGARILADNPALTPLVPLVRHHHERYDGGGYPSGIAGAAIPLGAAIIAIADTYDTMTTDRPYRRAPGHERARDEIVRCGGAQFHPDVVRAFLVAIESAAWQMTTTRSGPNQANGPQLAARLAGANTRAMNITYQIAQTIGDVTDLEGFTQRVAELLRRELGTRAADIFLLDDATGDFVQATPLPDQGEVVRVPAGGGLIGWAAQHQQAARVDDAREDARVLFFDGWDGRSEIAVPLISQGRTFGVINVESQRVGAFTEEDETVLVMVARQLAQVLEVARLHDRVKRTATQDALTGVANYRAFHAAMERALAGTAATGTPVALMLIDLDGLKQLNDTHGHLAGDAAIRAIAALLDGASRDGELVARYGGDEFAVILPGLDEVAATRRAKELAQAVREAATFVADDAALPLPELSYGVATCGLDGDRTRALVAAADARMYAQKLGHYAALGRPRRDLVARVAVGGAGEATVGGERRVLHGD